ncbi:sulfite exporter TauE/SafE family protein [uncultured Capnocytophaga sp.]|uniref:sulfite exporter TauE/SafE family protein n=1 Tax=uncultured Capnocytophaga sp. TaxID=159273 RepID=UPI0026256CD1|nr:sulfite exporter TauE/SafE family protein [uncultured Capnocytophaga sp.]
MFILAFSLGLIGSLHCVGMCGPIALLLPLQRQRKVFRWIQLGAYFLGKTLAYTLIGLLFGIVGEGLFIAEYQQEFSILAGLVMIGMGLFSLLHISLKGIQNPLLKGFALLKNALGRQLTKKTLSSSLFIGFLNGFLPCGLVYTALFGALAMGNLRDSMGYMTAFGLGTIPLMLLLVVLGDFLPVGLRRQLNQWLPMVVIVVGILFVLRGLGLGIPYLSPADTHLLLHPKGDC